MHGVDFPLHLHMGFRFEREGAPLRLDFCACQCSFDIFRSSVVAFDEVAVVTVHHADEVGQFGGRVWMEAAAEFGGFPPDFYRQVSQFRRDRVLEEHRFDRC